MLAAEMFGKQSADMATQIWASIDELRAAAVSCRSSAEQYEQHDVLPS